MHKNKGEQIQNHLKSKEMRAGPRTGYYADSNLNVFQMNIKLHMVSIVNALK